MLRQYQKIIKNYNIHISLVIFHNIFASHGLIWYLLGSREWKIGNGFCVDSRFTKWPRSRHLTQIVRELSILRDFRWLRFSLSETISANSCKLVDCKMAEVEGAFTIESLFYG
jgi:hypothetical protein